MRKLFFVVMAIMAMTGCDNAPVFHGLTQQEKETCAQSIMGEYPGRYTIVYTDKLTTGANTDLMRETIDSVTFSVSDMTTHSVVFNNFPLRLLARVVDNTELGNALSTLPGMGLTGNYEFKRAADDGKVEWYFDFNPVALSLTYGGKQHDIVLHFRNTNNYITFDKEQTESGTVFGEGRQLAFELDAIYEGDTPLQLFNDGWQEGPELMTVFHFGL